MLSAFLALASPAPQHPSVASTCRLDRAAACVDTNALVTSRGFADALRRFLGRQTGTYISSTPVWKQAFEALHGPPQRPQRVGDMLVFGACVAHDCPDKGAIAVDRDGAIVGVALIFSACGERPRSDDCSIQNRLVVFQHQRGARLGAAAALREWAFNQGPAVASSLAGSARAHPPKIVTF